MHRLSIDELRIDACSACWDGDPELRPTYPQIIDVFPTLAKELAPPLEGLLRRSIGTFLPRFVYLPIVHTIYTLSISRDAPCSQQIGADLAKWHDYDASRRLPIQCWRRGGCQTVLSPCCLMQEAFTLLLNSPCCLIRKRFLFSFLTLPCLGRRATRRDSCVSPPRLSALATTPCITF